MRILLLFVIVVVSLASAVGCTTPSGEWNAQGFQEKTYGWKASYPTGQTHLLGADWQLDNWHDESGNLVAKDGPKYIANLEEDENRDGKIDPSETHKIHIFDLKYVNGRDNGVIWVQTRAMHPLDAARDLDVMLGNYADSLTGTGLYENGSVFGVSTIKARSFTTFVADRKEVRLGPHRALRAVIELAQTEHLRADPASRAAKIGVVLTKFYYLEPLEAGQGIPVADIKLLVNEGGRTWRRRTAVLLVGYYNDAEHFDRELPDFDAFVSRLAWPSPHPVADPSPPPAAAASAAAAPPAP